MTIDKKSEGGNLTLALTGRLDTITAPELEKVVLGETDGVSNLVLNLEGLEYLSSAGLRVILAAQKKMKPPSAMVIKNANETIKEIFDMTGFSDILNIE